jgi:hypothetical protein
MNDKVVHLPNSGCMKLNEWLTICLDVNKNKQFCRIDCFRKLVKPLSNNSYNFMNKYELNEIIYSSEGG